MLSVVLAQGIGELLPASSRALAGLSPSAHAALAPQLAEVFQHANRVLLIVTLLAFIPAAFLPRRRRPPAPLAVASGELFGDASPP